MFSQVGYAHAEAVEGIKTYLLYYLTFLFF
jgi:hypothetical protein